MLGGALAPQHEWSTGWSILRRSMGPWGNVQTLLEGGEDIGGMPKGSAFRVGVSQREYQVVWLGAKVCQQSGNGGCIPIDYEAHHTVQCAACPRSNRCKHQKPRLPSQDAGPRYGSKLPCSPWWEPTARLFTHQPQRVSNRQRLAAASGAPCALRQRLVCGLPPLWPVLSVQCTHCDGLPMTCHGDSCSCNTTK